MEAFLVLTGYGILFGLSLALGNWCWLSNGDTFRRVIFTAFMTVSLFEVTTKAMEALIAYFTSGCLT